MTRFRVTLRGVDIELRGFVDGPANLQILAKEVDDMGLLVIASEADDDYNPFHAEDPITDAEWREFQSIPDQGYSHRAWVDQQIQRRLNRRELHHFEAEQIIERIIAARSNHPERDKHDENDPVTCGWKRAVQDIDAALEKWNG